MLSVLVLQIMDISNRIIPIKALASVLSLTCTVTDCAITARIQQLTSNRIDNPLGNGH